MSKKQKIYQEMLRIVLINARNACAVLEDSRSSKVVDRSCYYESELIHNLWVSLFDAEFTDHDIWFLNVQARGYFDNAKGTQNYDQLCALVLELVLLVPPNFRGKLKWNSEIRHS